MRKVEGLNLLGVRMMGLALVFAAAIHGAAHADEATEKKAIHAQYERIQAAMRKKDAKAMMQMFAPDFTNKSPDGKVMNRSQVEAEAQKMLPSLPAGGTTHIALGTIKLTGDRAVVPCNTFWIVTTADPSGARGKMHTMVVTNKSTDVWTKVKGAWLMKHSEDLPPPPVMMDGKPILGRK